MKKMFIPLVLVFLLSGCMGLPTVEPTATPVPTATATPTVTATPTAAGGVTIVGNVWLRDSRDVERGYLLAGAVVDALCAGDWCYVGNLKFWRGCSSDNPDRLDCKMR